ncbi:MAG: hypothetical protein K1X83_15535 [Oligoflexia bacterium]|nr:hypothetical protein [Oligoflexia bacterium]
MAYNCRNAPHLHAATRRPEAGIALVAAIMMLALLGTLFSAYFILTHTEQRMAKGSKDAQSGFNAAESALNIRAEEMRSIFKDWARPSGTAPSADDACEDANQGTGDFMCKSYDFSTGHHAISYVTEASGNPYSTVLPPGETFEGLTAQEYRYTVRSIGRSRTENNEAILDLAFFSRLVPLFQFAIFFQDDLEIFNGATFTVDGRVHTNGNFYISPQTGGTTNLTGQVTVANKLYRGQKSQSTCSGYTGTAAVSDTPDKSAPNYVALPGCSTNRVEVTDVASWKRNLLVKTGTVKVPDVSVIDSFSSNEYWQLADLRLALRLDAAGNPDTTNSATGVEVVDTGGENVASATASLHSSACSGLISSGSSNFVVGTRGPADSSKLRLYREYQYDSTTNNFQRTLEIDMGGLLNCIQQFPGIMSGRLLSDSTQNGLVFFFAIDGPLSGASNNNYSVRIRNGASLQSTLSGASVVKGLTVVSDQGLVVWGNYNSTGWVPAALLSDTTWLLSNAWTDAESLIADTFTRAGNATSVYAALLTGIRRTGDANGSAGEDHGADSNGGGAINAFRFNEWFRTGSGGIPDFTYVGSIVSLGPPRKSGSTWGPFTYYSAPNRAWSYETRFNDPSKLPPMTPTFVNLKQELFMRDYDTGQ